MQGGERAAGVRKKGMVKSSARVLDVFEYFQAAHRPARVSEISKALGIPNSSTDELVRTLVERGYLVFDPRTRCFSPAYKAVALGSDIENRFFGGKGLANLLKDLRDSTGATVMLAVQRDCWTECVATESGTWMMPRSNRHEFALVAGDERGCGIGSNFGGALLAAKSDLEIIDTVKRAKKIGLVDRNVTTLDRLLLAVNKVRERGFSVCRTPNLLGVDSIATAFSFKAGTVPLAVGLMGQDLLASDRTGFELGQMIKKAIWRHVPSPSLLG